MELRRLNLKYENRTKLLKIDPDTIPTLVPKSILSDWIKDDENPYYKIQAMKYPIKANNINYQESFFEEFISKLKERPIPGNKYGHETAWGKRATTDFILVGAKLDKKGNGKGTVYLKNYIPPVGESGDNEIFIRANKSDMIHYSLVSYTRDEVVKDKDGSMIINVIGSVKGERNDAVEYGLGAMEQKTNEDIGVADNNNKSIVKEKTMDKKELFGFLKTYKDNAEITLLEAADAMGLSNQIITEKHTNALIIMDEFSKLNVDNPIEQFKAMQEQLKKNAETVFEARMTQEFGAEKNENKTDNLLRKYAQDKLKDIESGKLENAIKELKENDPIAKKFAEEQADYTSQKNILGRVEESIKDEESVGRRVDEL